MKITSLLRASSLGFILAILAGCSPSLQVATPVSGLPSAVARAKSGALLYSASLQYGTVTIYTYPQAQEVTSFNVPGDPAGLCSDKAGDVFMAEPYGRMVEEYKHGQTSPSASFSFPPSPYGCAVDDASKQLAVANEAGSVGVFDLSSKGSNPTTYTYPGIESFFLLHLRRSRKPIRRRSGVQRSDASFRAAQGPRPFEAREVPGDPA